MKILFLLPFIFATHFAWATSDQLASRTLTLNNPNAAAALDKLVSDLPSFFHGYQPQLDSGTKLITPLQVSGSNSHPILTMTIEKCVLIACETVTFDGEVSYRPLSGGCQHGYEIDVDLSHSSDALRDVYDRFTINVCLSGPKLQITAIGERAPTFQSGMVQEQISEFLQSQVQPITADLQKNLD